MCSQGKHPNSEETIQDDIPLARQQHVHCSFVFDVGRRMVEMRAVVCRFSRSTLLAILCCFIVSYLYKSVFCFLQRRLQEINTFIYQGHII